MSKLQCGSQTSQTRAPGRPHPVLITPLTPPQPDFMKFECALRSCREGLSRVHAVGAFGPLTPAPLPKGEGDVSARRIMLTVQLQIQRGVESFPLPGGPGGEG